MVFCRVESFGCKFFLYSDSDNFSVLTDLDIILSLVKERIVAFKKLYVLSIYYCFK